MNAQDIKAMFEGIDDDTKEIIARKLRPELSQAIAAVNNKMAAGNIPREQLSPPPEMIFNWAKECSLRNAKIVLIGQDPFIKPGEAMGLSFSVPRGKTIPPSTRNIYACLVHHGLMKEAPDHGDLTNWARQGVILLNCALTTELKKSNAHAKEWEKYTDALLREISALPQQMIFILLGGFAQEKARLIDKRRHVILEWGHPSPLNGANQTDNPKNFKYCNAFVRANDILICRAMPPINWDPNNVGVAPTITLEDVENARLRAQGIGLIPMMAPPVGAEPVERREVPAVAAPAAVDLKPVYILREAGGNDPAPLTASTLWIFTDGGSKGNGKANCSSSWAFYITDGCICLEAYGIVEEKEIPGEVFKSSNNRGELTAMQKALEFTLEYLSKFSFDEIILVSDSEYSIGCLNVWAAQWFANPAKHKLSEKKNLDIIVPAKEALDEIKGKFVFNFKHVKSHKDEPQDNSSEEWFLWKCNDIVDKLCNKALGRNVKC